MSDGQHQQRYRVIDKIAAGGMAEVFRAESAGIEGFKKKVAIKRVLPHLGKKRKFISMFLDEARLSARLTHSNVVQVFDIGIGDDTYFIVMEYIDGSDLKAIIETLRKKNEPFPVSSAAYIAIKMCEGLAYAHDLTDSRGVHLGIVHRDVSPPNVLITRYGEVKITDFGLARANNQLEESEPGIIKGKFSYLAPEAATGGDVDVGADIFAVGIILWEMLAGRKLFKGESDYETVRLVQQAKIPPLAQFNDKVPASLERIILKALARDLSQRYKHTLDLAADLNTFIFNHGHPVGAWDVARLVSQALDDRKRKKSAASANIIDELIKQALFEFTSLGTSQDQSYASPSGGRSTPSAMASPLDGNVVRNWESEILIQHPFGQSANASRDSKLLSTLQGLEAGNLSALEDILASSTNDLDKPLDSTPTPPVSDAKPKPAGKNSAPDKDASKGTNKGTNKGANKGAIEPATTTNKPNALLFVIIAISIAIAIGGAGVFLWFS